MTTTPGDELLRRVLTEAKTFACVGVSPDPVRPSNYVARYLVHRGYRVIPINPGHAGRQMFGETILASLAEIPKEVQVDVVDIFRRPEAVPAVVDEALAHLMPGLRTIWMQIGVTHAEAAAKAEAAGLTVIQDRCPKMEHQRLFGELRKAGINTGIVSSRLG